MPKLLKTRDIARRLGVHLSAVRAWCEQGRGPRFIRTPNGHYRFKLEDVEQWIAKLENSETTVVKPGAPREVRHHITPATPGRDRVLAAFHAAQRPVSANELARQLNISRQAACRHIRRLQAPGRVRKCPHGHGLYEVVVTEGASTAEC